MKAGLCSYAYRWAISHPSEGKKMNVFSFVDRAVELEADAIQICDNLPIEFFSDDELASLKEQIKKNPLSLELGMKGSQPERVEKMMDHCNKWYVDLLVIVLSDKDWNLSKTEYKGLLADLTKLAEDKNVVLAIENHFEMSPNDLAHIIDVVNSPNLGVCMDVVNSVTHLCGYKETCNVLSPYTVSVHIKDVEFNRFQGILKSDSQSMVSQQTRREILDTFSTGFYISGCRLGEGVIDINWIINEISKYNYNPNIFIESWMDPKSTIDETLLAEQNMVENDFITLKNYIYE